MKNHITHPLAVAVNVLIRSCERFLREWIKWQSRNLLIYNQKHIAALMVEGDLLVLQQLRYSAGIVPRTTIKTLPFPKPLPAEVEAMQKVVERFSVPVFIQDYHDSYAERIHELIDRKTKGLPSPRKERPAPHATPETDIEATLRHMLQVTGITAGGQ